MNLAIFTPSKNPYSETFIQAHKKYLKGNIFYYYGSGLSMKLEGEDSLISKADFLALKLKRKLQKLPYSYLWINTVLASLKKNKIDAVLVEYGTHAFQLLPVLKQLNIPVVVHFHGYDATRVSAIKACNNYKEVFELSKYVVAVSNVMYNKLLNLGCSKDKLVYNVYGPQPEFESIKPAYSKKQFITAGRFTDKKAPYYTILAFNEVAKKHKDVKLLMAGDGLLFAACKNLVKYLQLESQVQFLGIIKPEELKTYFEESLAYVQHSITAEDGDMEGTPLAILEASVAGLPVVSTNHAGIPDVIKHEETGLLCDEHDVDTMANYMLTIVEDDNYARTLGINGKKRISTQFSLQRHIDVLNQLLES